MVVLSLVRAMEADDIDIDTYTHQLSLLHPSSHQLSLLHSFIASTPTAAPFIAAHSGPLFHMHTTHSDPLCYTARSNSPFHTGLVLSLVLAMEADDIDTYTYTFVLSLV